MSEQINPITRLMSATQLNSIRVSECALSKSDVPVEHHGAGDYTQ